MEDSSSKEIKFLEKPVINIDKLSYIIEKKEIYVNLFEFNTIKELKLYKYPLIIKPEIENNAYKLLQSVIRKIKNEMELIYGNFTISGDSLYSMKKIENRNIFKSTIYLKGKYEYIIEVQSFSNEKIIKQEDVKKDNLTKQFIEIIIKDILLSNPDLEFDKGLFVLKKDKRKIESNRVSINYYPGFITKFIDTEKGGFINVSLKNKIESTENILEYLNRRKYKDKDNQYKIAKDLIGRWFYFGKKKYKIDEILFDRNPKNHCIYVDGKSMTIENFYLQKYKLTIKDNSQPLILNNKKGPQNKILKSYYLPELCTFSGLDESQQKNNFFMKELSSITKITPETRITQTNKFLELLLDETTYIKRKIGIIRN